ncbi:MAG TPA: HAD-IA family hydrolase [Solirubrobacteraceae bacterium]|nr:HAD-IA family hydrolase [Solirubrobacteraceae bacterium]
MTVLLCDLDGVLVDSTAAIARVYREWAARRGLDGDVVVRTAQGTPSREVVRALLPELDAVVESEVIEAAHVADQEGVVAVAGAREVLLGDRVAVVTSCSPALAAARFAAAGLPAPEVLVTTSEVARGKPDPEGYLLAAARLGAAARECVVLEDAPAGVAAGLAAEMRVIAVLTSHSRSELTGAHAYVADLRGVRALAAELVVG